MTIDQNRRLELLATVVDLGLQVLTARFLTILSLVLDAAMFAWAMSADSWQRILGASLFAISGWCIVNLQPDKERKRE